MVVPAEILSAWQDYLKAGLDWQELVAGIEPKATGCGPVYEIPNPLNRPGESFAIADMRALEIAEPHKHINGEVEIYFVLQGSGHIAIGKEIRSLSPGDTVITPPNTVHITLPRKDLVLAVVNTPPFNPANAISILADDRTIVEIIQRLRTS